MSRFLFPWAAALALAVTPLAKSDDVDAEDVRQIKARLESVTEATDALRVRIQQLETEVGRLKAENLQLKAGVANAGKDAATQDQIKKLVDDIREVDKKREADNRTVLDKLEELKKIAATPAVVHDPVDPGKKHPHETKAKPAPAAEETKTDNPPPDAAAVEPKSSLPAEYDYYEHVVAKGDNLDLVIAAYNKEKGLKVRLKQVLDANPGLKPERMKVGQKIKIPVIK
jgi:predicted  nucleic acid-binding Zn-ribbon protein